jgi:hypothetical protein
MGGTGVFGDGGVLDIKTLGGGKRSEARQTRLP